MSGEAASAGAVVDALQYEHPGVADDMSDQLLKQVVAPFQSVEETLARPAWTATFAKHLIENGDGLDLFYLLFLLQFDADPTEARARQLYDFFFANHGMTTSLEVDEEVVLSIERQLNQPPVNLAVLRKLFERPREEAMEIVADHLSAFVLLVADPARSAATGAARLIALLDDDDTGAMVTEKGVIKAMLQPILRDLRGTSDKDPESLIRSHQLYTSLSEFLETHGIVTGIARGTSVSSGRSWKMQNLKTSESGAAARYKGKKVHTHKGHHFVVTTYMHPTWCGHCGNLLWGLMKQGWRCVDCGFDVHKAKDRTGYTQCHRNLVDQCPGFRKKAGFRRQASGKSADSVRRSKSPMPSRKARFDSQHKRNLMMTDATIGSTDVDSDSMPGTPTSGRSLSGRSSLSVALSVTSQTDDEEDDDDDDVVEGPAVAISEAEMTDPRKMMAKGFKEWCDPARYKQMDKKEKARQEALFELIRTEAEYTWYLMVIEQVFKRRASESGKLSHQQLQQLFGNISALVKVHRKFRATLEELQEKHSHDAIVAPGQTIRACLATLEKTEYAQFVSNQGIAREAYHDLQDEALDTVAKCELWEPIAKQRWKLTDFLMQPLQRVSKYPLLLQAVLKYTPAAEKEERAALEGAIGGSDDLLRYLNKVNHQMEVRRRLQKVAVDTTYSAEITGEETEWILKMFQTHSEILYEGRLELRNREGKKERDMDAFVLKDALLLLRRQTKSQGSGWCMERYSDNAGNTLLPIVLFGGVHCTLNNEERSGTSFYVIRSELSSFVYLGIPQMYELVAAKSSDAKKWVAAIKKASHTFESENPDWKEMLLERYNARSPGPVLSPTRASESDVGFDSQGGRSSLRRTASDRPRRSPGAMQGGRGSPHSSSARDATTSSSLGVPFRSISDNARSSEGTIADHSAHGHLQKCCADFVKAISHFERKGLSATTDALAGELDGARTAAETLSRRLHDVRLGKVAVVQDESSAGLTLPLPQSPTAGAAADTPLPLTPPPPAQFAGEDSGGAGSHDAAAAAAPLSLPPPPQWDGGGNPGAEDSPTIVTELGHTATFADDDDEVFV